MFSVARAVASMIEFRVTFSSGCYNGTTRTLYRLILSRFEKTVYVKPSSFRSSRTRTARTTRRYSLKFYTRVKKMYIHFGDHSRLAIPFNVFASRRSDSN